MAQSVTISELRTRARRMAKMEGSTFISDTELDSLLISGTQRITDRLNGQGQEYARRTVETNTVPGQYLYDLPPDFYRLQLLTANRAPAMPVPSNDWLDAASDSDGWIDLFPFAIADLAVLRNNTNGQASTARYRLRGVMGSSGAGGESGVIEAKRQIEIRPTPRVVYTLCLDYIPVTPVPTGSIDSHTIDGLNGFEIIPVLETVIFMLSEEESDATHYKEWLVREEKRLEQVAPAQDQTRPETVVDVFGIVDGFYNGDPLAYRVPSWRRGG